MASIHLPIRQLVEFLLRTGSIDSRFAGFDRANEGARIHRKLQKAAGEGYQAEVFLSGGAGSLRHRLYAGGPGRRHFHRRKRHCDH